VGFTDQTGNLRSSMGYVIFRNGRAIRETFQQVKAGSEGVKTGRSIAMNIGGRYSAGIVLVVVAGMNYAIHVESRGRDVLSSAEHYAQKELPELLKELVSNINKAFE
jgi:hypothetical protein